MPHTTLLSQTFFVDKKIIQNIFVIELLFIYLQQIKPTTFKKRANSLTFKFRNTLYKRKVKYKYGF